MIRRPAKSNATPNDPSTLATTSTSSSARTKRRRTTRHGSSVLTMVILIGLAVIAWWVFLVLPNIDNGDLQPTVLPPRSTFKQQHQQQFLGNNEDVIVKQLLELARMPSEQLRELLENNPDEDPFQLTKLEQGICPFDHGTFPPAWLPPTPNPQHSDWFHNPDPNNPKVLVYYEHLSKAGGTSFCKLAQSNMPKKEVPGYYCMPSEPKMPDARVGSWNAAKLLKYALSQPHRLVSNEWEPFQHEFLQFQNHKDLILLLVTSIRNPVNRLLSAYKFWGHLHNPAEIKPTLPTWLKRYGNRAKRWKIADSDFVANVGRFNFATWKFSGGTLGVSELQLHADEEKGGLVKASQYTQDMMADESLWKDSYVLAVQTLAKFDLVIPMELLSNHTEPLHNLLGWADFSQNHVVPSGKIVNNDASNLLSQQEIQVLWHANKLDFVLYYWLCAVYLTRLYCPK